MNSAYYDATYLLKLQIVEAGTNEVRAHATSVLEIHTANTSLPPPRSSACAG
jgi:hypothetical protein